VPWKQELRVNGSSCPKIVQMRMSPGKIGVKGGLARANLAKMAKITILEEKTC
jgi:hypothetical protein